MRWMKQIKNKGVSIIEDTGSQSRTICTVDISVSSTAVDCSNRRRVVSS